MLLLFARTHLSCPVHQPGRNHATRVVKVIQENWNKETKEIFKRNSLKCIFLQVSRARTEPEQTFGPWWQYNNIVLILLSHFNGNKRDKLHF